LFTGQNPFQTPQAQQNPDPQAKYAAPGFGQPKLEDLQKQGIPFKVSDPNGAKDPNDYEGRVPDPKPAAPADAKKDTAAKDKDKDAKDKDGKSAKDKDGKDKDAKDKDGKSKDGKADADADKDKEKAEAEKAKEKEAAKPVGPYNPLKDAIALMSGGRTEQALTVLADVLKKNPANAEAHYLAGIGWVTMRNYPMAAEEYRVVLRLVPATQLASLAVEGLKKIGAPAITKDTPSPKLPPLRQSPR
jgi:hypothetical protein